MRDEVLTTPLVRIEEIAFSTGDGGKSLCDLAFDAVRKIGTRDLGGVIVATFSNPERFPSLAVRLATALALPPSVPAFDLQMACSAYPYAVYLAGRISADTGKRILVVDGDVQSPLVNPSDHATGKIFSDAVTASVIRSDPRENAESAFAFLSRADEALKCPSQGPIFMDGMKVFTFVATEVRGFIREFIAHLESCGLPPDSYSFVPHQAQPYMVRQLAKSLGLEHTLVTLDPARLNPGSCSIPLALAQGGRSGRALLAGFGAGFSASAALVDYAPPTIKPVSVG